MNVRKILDKTEKNTLFAVLALLAVLLVSLAFYCVNAGGHRYVFRFQSVDSGKNNVEWRLLPRKKGAEKISLYVDELLLGPKTERSRPLFSPGTKAEFCFLRSRTLYVNLSAVLLEKTGNASEIMNALELFKDNIRRSFPSVREVEVYIGGKPVFKK